ncbi:hypothetical protein QQX09_00040 [Demequina sp. SYSU T00192]|uniref:Uncharacterized protein n=1 Tax=Demequina litoralis TaxID=3051660 RepID=A0ABT8G598_9MICO|nr:hypothetical protein [Demequina sp. SYSU T00192]MDN4474237.1 hypothetical protein [Demequina sp. SYSU T00192]
MIASGRDIVGTVLAGGAVTVAWAHAAGLDWPLVDSARTTAGIVYVLGVAACAGGSADSFESDPQAKRWYHRVGGLLSIVATAALVWTLVTGATAPVILLASVVAVKWLFATVRHLATAAPAPATAT